MVPRALRMDSKPNCVGPLHVQQPPSGYKADMNTPIHALIELLTYFKDLLNRYFQMNLATLKYLPVTRT